MDKPKEKKHVHLNAEEKRHVAELIANGASYKEVNSWHIMRFPQPDLNQWSFRGVKGQGGRIKFEQRQKKT